MRTHPHLQRTTAREDLITIGLATWMIIGLMVDAYFHSTDPGLETFWTPWHALFYSGFSVTALWIIRLSLSRRAAEGGVLDWAPPGYRGALVGLAVFGAGGVGDAVWHSVFGVETGIDALLSPTHLLLFVGMLAIVSAPLRAAWGDRHAEQAPGFGTFLAPLLSLTWATALVAFFFEYAWLPAADWVPRVHFDPATGQGELVAAVGIVGTVLVTAILMTGPLLASRRWRLPFGSVTFLFVLVDLLITVGFDEDAVGIPAMILAGLFADVVLTADRLPRWVVAGGTPLVLWSFYFIAVGRVEQGIEWPPELWGGAIVFGVLTGLAIELLLHSGEMLARAGFERDHSH